VSSRSLRPNGKATATATSTAGKRTAKRSLRSEHDIQTECVRWAREQAANGDMRLGLLFAIPNGVRTSRTQASKLLREGLLSGAFDLFLSHPNPAGSHGLYIEMKTPEGRLSREQRVFAQNAEARGYSTIVCRSLVEFQRAVWAYLAEGEGA
jgi:hypothetical protein